MSEGDNINGDDPLMKAAMRALGLVDAHGGIGKPKNGRWQRPMDVALVELMVENIKAGFVTVPSFLNLPGHLPDTERELRSLQLSNAARDQVLKNDLAEWVSINRRVVGQAAVTLANAMKAVRMAYELLEEEHDDHIEQIKGDIEAHLYRTFKITIVEMPADLADLQAWCEKKLSEMSPVPEWLRDGSTSGPPGANLFAPKKKAGSTMRLVQDIAHGKVTGYKPRKEEDDE